MPKDKFNNLDIPDSKKMNALHHYNTMLDEDKNYHILKDYGMFDFDKNPMQYIITQDDRERDFVNKMKVFARFHSAKEHASMINSLLLEKNIREYLSYYRDVKKYKRHDKELSGKFSNKRIFKLLRSKILDDDLIPNDLIKQKESDQASGEVEEQPFTNEYDQL